MRLLLLLLVLAGCVDASQDTTVTTVVYQFADITVGDTIPNTTLVWSAEDAREVMRTLDRTVDEYMKWGGWYVTNCMWYHKDHQRVACFDARVRALAAFRDQYIRELQILGVQ